MRKAFTLIELLVVIAIIAILAVVVVLTLNPAELLKQSRDANRISDMATLNSAINIYNTDQSGAVTYSLGTANTSYISVPFASGSCATLGLATSAFSYSCSSSSTYRNVNNTGWIPVNFQALTSGSPISNLPVDPTNQTSSNLYYSYLTSGTTFAISSFMESQKYAKVMATTGGVDPALDEAGSGAATLSDAGRGLIGYWPFNEGSGVAARDWSGEGENAAVQNSWTTGKTAANAYTIASGTSITYPSAASTTLPSSQITVSVWINVPAFVNYQDILGTSNWASNGSWLLYTCVGCGVTFGVIHGVTFEQAVGCLSSFTTSTWHYIVGTYDGNVVSSYLDGSLCATTPIVGQALTSSGVTLFTTAPSGGPYSINDLRLYDRALSAAEIQEIYNAEK